MKSRTALAKFSPLKNLIRKKNIRSNMFKTCLFLFVTLHIVLDWKVFV